MNETYRYRLIIETPPFGGYGFPTMKAHATMFRTQDGAADFAREHVRFDETWYVVETVDEVKALSPERRRVREFDTAGS